jgi:hypothetical protein
VLWDRIDGTQGDVVSPLSGQWPSRPPHPSHATHKVTRFSKIN